MPFHLFLNAISCHKVREAVAGGIVRFEHIPGNKNPADMHTKPLPWSKLREYVEPLLFWKGDTKDAPTVSQNPEGSVAGPDRDVTQESQVEGNGWRTVVRSRGRRRGAHVPSHDSEDLVDSMGLLSGTMYEALREVMGLD